MAIASFFVSDENTKPKSLTTKLAIANEQLSFIMKNVSSNRMRASRIVTAKNIDKTRDRKFSYIYQHLKLYFDKKSYRQVSKIILLYVHVVFMASFFLLFKILRIYFLFVVQSVQTCTLPTLGILYIRQFADSTIDWRFNVSYISQYISLICDYFR